MKKLFVLFEIIAAFLMFIIVAKADNIQLDSLWQKNFKPKQVGEAKFSPNGEFIAMSINPDIDHQSDTVRIKPVLLNCSTGEVVREFVGLNCRAIYALDFSHDGSLLASGGWSNNDTAAVCIWNVSTGNLERTLLVNDSNLKDYQYVNQIIFSPNGEKLFINISGSKKLPNPPYQQNVSRLLIINTQTWQVDRYINDFQDYIRISPDNRFYSTDYQPKHYIKLYDFNNDSLVYTFVQRRDTIHYINWYDYSPDSSKIAISDVGMIYIYDLATFAQVDSISFTDSTITYKYVEPIKYFPNSRYLFIDNVTTSTKKFPFMEIYDLQSKQFVYQDSSDLWKNDIASNSTYFLRINIQSIRLDTIRFIPQTAVKENPDNEGKSSAIYPNPVSDFLILNNIPPNIELQKIQIFSALGEKLIETEYKERIDVSWLAPGVYFVKVGDRVGKFVKM